MLQLFSGVFIEDPSYLCEVALALIDQQEQQDQRKTKKERQAQSVATIGKVMELVTLRHRMLEATWESELLSNVSSLSNLPVCNEAARVPPYTWFYENSIFSISC